MKSLYPRFTNILSVNQVSDGFIVLENTLKLPSGASNLYKVNVFFNLIWEAELPKSNDAYVGKIVEILPNVLKAFSTEGFNCEIDLGTGKILKKHWSK